MSQSAGGSIKPQKSKAEPLKSSCPPIETDCERREGGEGVEGGERESDFESLFKSVLLMSCPRHGNVSFSRVFHSTCGDGLGLKTKKRGGKCREKEATGIFFARKTTVERALVAVLL